MKKFLSFLFIFILLYPLTVVRAEDVKGLDPPSLPDVTLDTVQSIRGVGLSPLLIPGLPEVDFDSPGRPSLVSLTLPSLPEVLREEADRWGLPPLSAIKLPETDLTKSIEYQTADFTGGVSSVFSVKPANMADDCMNMLPDSVPGANARKGYDRLSASDSSYDCYGLGVGAGKILCQLDYRTMWLDPANSYKPTTIPYYRYFVKVDSLRTRIPTFFTPVNDGVLITNGEDEPALYDGVIATYLGVKEKGTVSYDSLMDEGVDSVKIYDSTKVWTDDELVGYIVRLNREQAWTDSLRIRQIVDNGTNWFILANWQDVIYEQKWDYHIVGVPDRGETIDSGSVNSGNAPNYFYADTNIITEDNIPVAKAGDQMTFVEIVKGRGYGQVRHVCWREAASDAWKLHVDPLWDVVPNTHSEFIIYKKYMPRGNNGVIANDYYIGSGGDPFKNRIYISAQGNYGDFGAIPEDYISAPGDVNYILNLGGNVWCFGDDWIGRILSASNLHVFVKNVGCPFPHTIAVWGNDVYWLANDGVWTTQGSATYYQEGAAGLSKISAPIQDEFVNLHGRSKYAGGGFDGTGKYWLSISTDSDTIPDKTWVWDTKTKSWWPQDTLAFSYYAFSEYPGDTSGFIFARKDSGYVYKYGATTDAGNAITYWWRRTIDDQPMNEKNARSVWFYGTFNTTLYAKLYENDAVVESLTWSGSGLEQKYDYWTQSSQSERLGFELKTTDSTFVIRAAGFEYEDLGRRPK